MGQVSGVGCYAAAELAEGRLACLLELPEWGRRRRRPLPPLLLPPAAAVEEDGSVLVHAIYEPPQQGSADSLVLERGTLEEARADLIATRMGCAAAGASACRAAAPPMAAGAADGASHRC